MRVQRVLAPGSTTESWTLLGDDLRPVGPVESFLSYLTATERSPNTIKAYAHGSPASAIEIGAAGQAGRSRGSKLR